MTPAPTVSHRAYALFAIKAVDDDQRIISGIATTPSTDRMGDIVEPGGAEFSLPIPLLWQHDPRAPIGHVTKATVTPSGIAITAKIFKVPEDGTLKTEIDRAWQSIKYALVRGLSIGFKPIEMSFLDDGGVRFLRWSWLELSAVTIPANQDATIAIVRSLALGAPARDLRPLAAAAAPPPVQRKLSMNPSDQITTWQKARAPKALAMQSLMTLAAETGRVLDANESAEYDTLAADVKAIDEHLTRLAALEVKAAAVATPIALVRSTAAARVLSPLPPGIEFARYAIALMAARGNAPAALEIAKARFPDQTRIHTLIKAAVAGGTTTDATWAGPLVDAQTLTTEFVEYLRPMTVVGKFGTNGIPSLRNIPFNVRITKQTSGGAGYWVGQAAAKPLTKYDFDAVTLLWAKVAAISVLSDELIRFSNPSAEALVRDALAGSLIARLDVDFIDPDKAPVSNVSPGSITNGIASTPTAGATPANVRTDVKALMETFIAANISLVNGVWIMPQTTALSLSLMTNATTGVVEFPGITMNGGTFFGLPVITSQYAAFASPENNIVVLASASDIFLSDDGGVTIDASREATLEMVDNPGGIAANVSMFQTNNMALRAERFINWQRRRTAAVAWMADVTWGG